MQRFMAKLEPVPHGGHYVVVPPDVAERAHLRYGMRVRGTVNEAAYRSSLMKYSGIFHLGIPRATLVAAGWKGRAKVVVTVEIDDEPLPTDVVPADLRGALSRHARAKASWEKLAPAHRRGFVKSVIGAKKKETRARRIAKIVETLKAGVPERRTWTPRPR